MSIINKQPQHIINSNIPWSGSLPHSVLFTTWDNGRHFLTRASALHVGLGVGGTTIVSGSRVRPTHSCDGWMCDLGVVGVSSIFGWVRGTGSFAPVSPTFVLVSRIHLTEQYRDYGHFLNTVSSSRHKDMVDDTLSRSSAQSVGLGVSGSTIVSGSCVRPSIRGFLTCWPHLYL